MPEGSYASKDYASQIRSSRRREKNASTTTSLVMPEELPIVEEALKDLVEAKTPLSVVAKKLGVSEESARANIRRLGLVVEEEQRKKCVFIFF